VFARASRAQLTAYKLAEEIINGQGGLLGRPIKLVIYDDQSSASQGVILYRRLIYQDKVDLLLGPFSSAVTFAVAPVLEQAKIPTLTPQAADPRIWAGGRRYVFGVLPNGYNYLVGAIDLAKEQGLRTVAILNQDSAFPIAAVEGVRRRVRDAGMQIVLDESYPTDATDFTTPMAKAKRANADIVIGGGYINDDIGLVKAAKAVDYSPKMITLMIGAADPNFHKELSQDGELITGNTNWEPYFTTPGNVDFVQRYKTKYNEDPYYDTAASFAAVMLLANAVKAVGRLDRDAIRTWLSSTKTQTVFGDYAVDQTGLQVGKQSAIFQWQKARREIVWPASLRTAPLVIPQNFWKK
jgi:branched-chain amino acid transport system substrate-binding protein